MIQKIDIFALISPISTRQRSEVLPGFLHHMSEHPCLLERFYKFHELSKLNKQYLNISTR